MKTRTLVTQRLYFGVDAFKLREASGRVLSRIAGLSADRAKVSATEIRRDFGIDTEVGQIMVEEMVAEGLLQPRDAVRADYRLTERFVEYANARVVEPLKRSRARQVVANARELAARINDEWTRNPLEIEAIAPFGDYISQERFLDKLPIGVLVRNRPASRRARWRMLSKSDGADEIRAAFKELSSFVQVRLVTRIGEVPAPFAVVFQSLEDE